MRELKEILENAIGEINHDKKDYVEVNLTKDECQYLLELINKK